MENLVIINNDGVLLVESRQIAEMVDKPHDQLMRSIRTYIEYLESAKMQSHGFFIESTYMSDQNKVLPCYLLTKKGCDMVANKMTGEKGVLFTAAYVTLFDDMQKQLQKPLSRLEILEIALESERKVLALQQQATIDKPKVEYFDALVDRNLLTNMRDTAKELQVKQNVFVAFLIEKKYIYRDSKKNIKPFAEYVPSLFELKEFTKGKYASTQVLVTPKGRETFRILLGK